MNLKKNYKIIEWLEQNEGMGCYVHIPFCDNICSYCDFCKMYYYEEWVNTYLESLEKEISSTVKKPLTTIYIGGGTPSCLNLEQLERLLKALKPYSDGVLEYSIEANPESMTKEKLELCFCYGVNRLSIGVQTFNDDLLKCIKRQHNKQQVFNMITTAKQIGYKDISIDLIYNLPHQTKQDIMNDIALLHQLDINHVSYYSLIVEKHTMIYNDKNLKLLDDQGEYEISTIINTELGKIGFQQYEVSNYCRNEQISIHNTIYWLSEHYYGLGLGAHGYENNIRKANTKKLSSYNEGQWILDEEQLSIADQMAEFFIVGLRLKHGVNLQVFAKRFKIDALDKYQIIIEKHINNGMLVIKNNRLIATTKGFDLLDNILIDFV